MIPPTAYEFSTFILAYSGGRDSTAALFWCLDNLPHDKLHIVHNPIDADWPTNDDYLRTIASLIPLPIEHVRAGDRKLPPATKPRQPWTHATSLWEMVERRRKWPSYWQRYCTKYLKTWPLRLYAAELDNPLLIFGERAEESPGRAKRPTFGPDTAHIPAAYRRPILRPLHKWSHDQVTDYLRQHNAPYNKTYLYAKRSSCWLCPLAGGARYQILSFMRRWPHRAIPWIQLEQQIGHRWKPHVSLADLWEQAAIQEELPSLLPETLS